MADVARFALAGAGNPAGQRALRVLLGRLDQALQSGTEGVKELVVVSFVENLIGEDEAVRALRPLAPPTLGAAIDAICRQL